MPTDRAQLAGHAVRGRQTERWAQAASGGLGTAIGSIDTADPRHGADLAAASTRRRPASTKAHPGAKSVKGGLGEVRGGLDELAVGLTSAVAGVSQLDAGAGEATPAPVS